MAKINNNTVADWHDGDTMHAPDYTKERTIIITAINDTDTRVDALAGADGVDTVQIKDGAVTNPKIAAGAVTNDKIASGVDGAKISDGTVTGAKIKDNSIISGHIVNRTITESKIQEGALDGRYYTEPEVDGLLQQNKTGNHEGTWQGLTPPAIGAGDMNGARITRLEDDIWNDTDTPVTLVNGQQTVDVLQDTFLELTSATGKTLANLRGRGIGTFPNVLNTTVTYNGESATVTASGATSTEHFADNVTHATLPDQNGYYIATAEWTSTQGKGVLRVYGAGLDVNTGTDVSWLVFKANSLDKVNMRLQLTNAAGVYSFVASGETSTFSKIRLYQITKAEYDAIATMTANQITTKYPYVDGVQNITNPYVTAAPATSKLTLTTELASDINGTVADTVVNNNGIYQKTSKFNKTALDRFLNWAYGESRSGLKIIYTPTQAPDQPVTATEYVNKYDGKLLKRGVYLDIIAAPDVSFIDGVSNINLSVANSDTGWGEQSNSNTFSGNSVQATFVLTPHAGVEVIPSSVTAKVNNVDTPIKTVSGNNVTFNTAPGMGVSNIIISFKEAYVPSVAEVKAYIYGWTMCHADGSAYFTGTKYWFKLWGGVGNYTTLLSGAKVAGTSVTVCPTTINDNQGYTSYQIQYQRKTAVTEIVSAEGILTLRKGLNTVVCGHAGAIPIPIVNGSIQNTRNTINNLVQQSSKNSIILNEKLNEGDLVYELGASLLSNALYKLSIGQPINITGLGDSIMDGYYADNNNGYMEILTASLNTKFTVSNKLNNFGISGYTVRDAFIYGQFTQADNTDTDLYVISFGHNDIKSGLNSSYTPGYGYPLAQSISDMEYMIRRLRTNHPNADMLILGEPPYDVTSTASNAALAKYTKEMQKLSIKYNCLFVDMTQLYISQGDYTQYLYSDGAHPSEAGHRLMAAELMKYFISGVTQNQRTTNTPVQSLNDLWRYTSKAWEQLNKGVVADGDRYRLYGTGWNASNQTTNAGDFVDIIARCNCIAVEVELTVNTRLLIGRDSIGWYNDYTFTSVYPMSPNSFWLTIPFDQSSAVTIDTGAHSVRLYLRAGMLKIKQVWALDSSHDFIACDNPIVTYSGDMVILDTDDTTQGFLYHKKRLSPNGLEGYSVTIPFIGTGLSGDFNIQSGVGTLQVSVDGKSAFDLPVGISGALGMQGGKTICKGLDYGQHTVTLTAKAGNTVKVYFGGFLVLDERRLETPRIQQGYCKAGSEQKFGVPYETAPTISVTGNGVYPTNTSKTGFTMSGTPGANGTWVAEGTRVVY